MDDGLVDGFEGNGVRADFELFASWKWSWRVHKVLNEGRHAKDCASFCCWLVILWFFFFTSPHYPFFFPPSPPPEGDSKGDRYWVDDRGSQISAASS